MDDILCRLIAAAGIEPRYWDIHGTLHETSDATARALLTALGFAAATNDDAEATLRRVQALAWGRLAAPAAVRTAGASITVPVFLPQTAPGTLRWTIRQESGATICGETAIAALPVEEEGEADGQTIVRRGLSLPPQPSGYHALTVTAGDREGKTCLIVSPGKGFLPAEFSRRRLFGASAQLYALRTQSDWGIGDFSSLHQVIDGLAAQGADVLGLNPQHALFLDAPNEASPYCPSSRLFKNPLYIDVTAVPEFATSAAAQEAAARLEPAQAAAKQAELIDYPAVAALKREVLEILFHALSPQSPRYADFRRFVAEGGGDLAAFVRFQVLSEHFGTHDWSLWPTECHDPNAAETLALCQREADRIAFFEYLQWLCEEQLAVAAAVARDRGMRIGLYNDLAVSVNTASADYWSHQDLFAGAARIGSPPDPFNEQGQEWGVIPMRPAQMIETGYRHTIALLRANMRHAGALRIDHVMGLQRLFLIPAGKKPADGAYVRYPVDDLFAIAALESARGRALLIGEDLGTVPEGFRERMAAANMLSCKVFYFEREGEGFKRPETFAPLAAASVSTHDLPTIRGYLEGVDIDARAQAGMYATPEEETSARTARAQEKRQLLYAVRDGGLLPWGTDPENPHQGWTKELGRAIQVYVSRAGSKLMLVQMDDLMAVSQQTNLPGSTWQHANWCRRHPRTLEEAFADPWLIDTLKDIAAQR